MCTTPIKTWVFVYRSYPNVYEYPCFYGCGAHASTVVPRPFLLHQKRPGNEARLLQAPTIQHSNCEIAVEKKNSRCSECSRYRRFLNIMCARLRHRQEMDKENRTAPTSRVNYCHLTSPEKNQRLLRLHTSLRAANRQVTRLRERVEAATAACGEVLDEEIHCDLQQIMEAASLHKHSPEFFSGIFWAQQQAAAKCSTSSSSLAPKLKHEHVYRTSFSMMRVDLAAQVHIVTYSNDHNGICTAGA